jgi:glycosyltransferase involved in cell wall biosynthesis
MSGGERRIDTATPVGEEGAIKVMFSPDIFVQQLVGGISRYHARLHGELLNLGVESTLFTGWRGHAYLQGMAGVRRTIGGRNGRVTRVASSVTYRSVVAGSSRYAIVHPTYYTSPTFRRRASVCTFHDLIHAKGLSPGRAADEVVRAQRRWVRAADRLIAVSQHTADDMVEVLGVERSRIRVIPLAVDAQPPFAGRPDKATGPDFVLFVGHRGGYKNWKAAALALTAPALRELHMVCVGGGPLSPPEKDLLGRNQLGDRVVQVFADDSELDDLYRRALCLLYPSYYEGFGLPPLEAMARGTPVVAADRASIPEVVSTAAVLCEPEADALAEGIERLRDTDIASELSSRGIERARQFTWRKTAERTFAVYRELAG